jgi:arylamine N-acetyltransferase
MSIPINTILQHLKLTPQTPSFDYLNQILTAWSSRIPWESASRIARHQQDGSPQDYACFAEDFFQNAMKYGTGGTCFESNFAFRTLLSELGFDGSLHFCDMEKEEPNPHCAVVVEIDGDYFIADVGYPISSPLQLHPHETTTVSTPVYRFTAIPKVDNCWEIRRSAGNYESQAFVLKGDPPDNKSFCERLIRDHAPSGLFLDEVILSRTTDSSMWRYSESKGLVKRTTESEELITLSPQQAADLPSTLAQIFDYDRTIIETALNRHTSIDKG